MKIINEPTFTDLNYNIYHQVIIVEKIHVLNYYFIFRNLEEVIFTITKSNAIQSSKLLYDYEIDFIKNNLKFISI